MTWEQRYRLKLYTSTSLVLWAGVSLLAALVVAPLIRRLDLITGWTIFGYSPEGARTLLGTLAGSMLTYIVFVLSATLIVVQLASAQLTPRVIAMVFAMPWIRFTLGAFTFTFTFTLSALARVEGRVPDLHVGIAVILNLGCIIIFFLFVQLLSSGLRPGSMMQRVATHGRAVIAEVYPLALDQKRPEPLIEEEFLTSESMVVPFEGSSGVVMAFSTGELTRLARSKDAIVQVVPQVGDSVIAGDPLFRVRQGVRPIQVASLRGCIAIGSERTLDQDPRFAFRILVDIAIRALSPAVNDPTTAVLALDQIDGLLHCLGTRKLDEGMTRDADGKPRVVYGTPNWSDFVMLAVTEIRHYGAGSVQVNRRLRAMLDHLMRLLPDSRRPPLEAELSLLGTGIARTFLDDIDRKRAGIGDNQGVGGSEP